MLHKVVSKSIDTPSLLKLIEVQRPYFALEDLQLDNDGWLWAKAPIECGSEFESCQMNASEVGRHLAILGSCYGALINPVQGKHYYLAHKALLTTFSPYNNNQRCEYLPVRAKAQFVGKRLLRATTELLTNEGELACTLDVDYHSLSEKAFNKIYASNIHDSNVVTLDNRWNGINPYASPIELTVQDINDTSIHTSIGKVTPEICVGHFDEVRALPVAILAQCLLNSCCIFLRTFLKNEHAVFNLTHSDLSADHLALAGQTVSISITLESSLENNFQLLCVATNNGGFIIGHMLVRMNWINKLNND